MNVIIISITLLNIVVIIRLIWATIWQLYPRVVKGLLTAFVLRRKKTSDFYSFSFRTTNLPSRDSFSSYREILVRNRETVRLWSKS